jgi:PAS domain S-box-containing protein
MQGDTKDGGAKSSGGKGRKDLQGASPLNISRILNSIQDGISMLDAELNVVMINSAMEQFFFDRLPIVGRKCYEAYHGKTEPCEVCPALKTMQSGKSSSKMLVQDDEVWLELVTFPVFNQEGTRVAGVIEHLRDISERRRTEVEIRKLNEELKSNVDQLSTANAALRDPRRAALNLMEDAVAARRRAEEATAELRREVGERQRIEEALRESEERVRLKLESILSPEGDIGNLELADIIDVQAVQALMDDCHKFMHIPMAILDLKGRVLVGVGWQEICTKFHRLHPETAKHCLESDLLLTDGIATGEFKLYKCKNNMWDVATPITVGGRQIGNLFLGQFFFDDEAVDNELFRKQAARYGFDQQTYLAALEQVPRISHEYLTNGMTFLLKFADIISKLSYSNIKLSRSLAELDSVTDSLQRAHDVLEQRVAERTQDLAVTVATLRRQILERERAEQALHDETRERLRILETLRENEQMLMQQSRLAAMGEMINNIAHQWRQPLNALGLLVQQIGLFYEMGEFDKEYLDGSVHKSMELIRHMSRTIDDFRNFFTPDKEKVQFAVHEVVAKALALVEESFNHQHIGLVVHALASPTVSGFPNEYSQTMLNILINARDALVERRPADAKVIVTIREEEGRSVVTIADNAGGIEEKVMDKIFEPYFTTKGPDRGTGVGLFMSKTIIEKNMGGKLTVRNTGNGAEFRIEV